MACEMCFFYDIAEAQDCEEHQLLVEEKVLSLSITELVELTKSLKLTKESLTGKSGRELLKLVRKSIDKRVEAFETEGEKIKYLEQIKERVKDKPPPLEENSPNGAVTTTTVTKENNQTQAEVEKSKSTLLLPAYQRKFKIVGTMGPESQND